MEHRSTLEIRSLAPGKIGGHAVLFNSPSQDLGGFTESVAPEALTRSLSKPDDIMCLCNHDTGRVLGRVKSGTLSLRTDDRGLYFECELPQTTYARDLEELIKRGDVAGCSFGFMVPKGGDEWEDRNGVPHRTLRNIDLREVTVTAFPAYTDTDVAKRSLEQHRRQALPPKLSIAVRELELLSL